MPNQKESRWQFHEFKVLAIKHDGFTLLELYRKRPMKVKRNLRKLRGAVMADDRKALLGIAVRPGHVLIYILFKCWAAGKNPKNAKRKNPNSKAPARAHRKS